MVKLLLLLIIGVNNATAQQLDINTINELNTISWKNAKSILINRGFEASSQDSHGTDVVYKALHHAICITVFGDDLRPKVVKYYFDNDDEYLNSIRLLDELGYKPSWVTADIKDGKIEFYLSKKRESGMTDDIGIEEKQHPNPDEYKYVYSFLWASF